MNNNAHFFDIDHEENNAAEENYNLLGSADVTHKRKFT